MKFNTEYGKEPPKGAIPFCLEDFADVLEDTDHKDCSQHHCIHITTIGRQWFGQIYTRFYEVTPTVGHLTIKVDESGEITGSSKAANEFLDFAHYHYRIGLEATAALALSGLALSARDGIANENILSALQSYKEGFELGLLENQVTKYGRGW